jgi:hypothetical protein
LKKKMAFALAALSILLVLTATISSTAALTPGLPGVKAGDTADYKVVGNPALPYNRTHISVLGTNGYYVALTSANYKPNGTLYSVEARNWSVDFYGGGSWNIAVFYWVVGGNFSNGAEILSAAPGVFVTDNLTMTAAGVSRFVLHATGTGVVVNYFDMYFDRVTGLVVQGNYDTPAGWINVTLLSTNVWSAPEGLSATTLLVIGMGAVIVVLLVAMVFIARRAGKHKK